jgi:hypothetical protein
MLRRMLLVVLAAGALAAPVGGATGSGLQGIVRKGPTTPVCRVGVPCTAPAVGVKLVFSRGGAVAGTVTTGSGGRYRIALRPGTYTVRTATKATIGRGLEPRTATVPKGRYARVDLMIDTGIR